MPSVAIAGCGLVGPLAALFFAQRNWKVDIYERRPDPRLTTEVSGRSINLTLSDRGRAALREVGLEDAALQLGIPVKGRFVHCLSSDAFTTPYGTEGQCNISIQRSELNQLLVDAAASNPNITMHFNSKVQNLTRDGVLLIETPSGLCASNPDLILACDGAQSTVRKYAISDSGFDYQQSSLSHGYIELRVDPKDGEFAMPENYFHLWPRENMCLIALANRDKSFTMSLFAPLETFESLKGSPEAALAFFELHFGDVVDLIGRDNITSVVKNQPSSRLMTVKCSPHFALDGKLLLIGDAAHAMVPFYGQGMNCGFEDCLVLVEHLDRYGDDHFRDAVIAYSAHRVVDAMAACDLALHNYDVLRGHVVHPSFRLRKVLDGILHKLMPSTWVPLYTMVTYSRMRYSEAVSTKEWQDWVVFTAFVTLLILIVMCPCLTLCLFGL